MKCGARSVINAALILAALCALLPVASAQSSKEDEFRELLDRATDLVAALELQPGDWVAEVGAGNCYYAPLLAKAVGPDGRVFQEDIVPGIGRNCRERMRRFSLTNVQAILGEPADPHLPKGLTVVLAHNSYHHFSNPTR
jgi:predicted methyltransferase